MFLDENTTPTEIRPSAQRLANAISNLMDAERDLEKAMGQVPSYTGQWDSKDYYAEEQNDYNIAANALEDVMRELFAPKEG